MTTGSRRHNKWRLLLALGMIAASLTPVAMSARGATADPRYCLVDDWPNLPGGLKLGQVAGLDVDTRGVVYVFHRGSKSWAGNPSFVDVARTFIFGLFGGDPSTETVTEDAILALHAETGELLSSFGAGHFQIPHGLTIDAQDNLWVTDVGLHQVFKYSKDGKLLLSLGKAGVAGEDPDHFDGPTDIAVGRDGSIYVADGYGNARVVKFAADGRYLDAWGGHGTAPGEFNVPHGIAIDAEDNLYVADRGNARIQVFDRDGHFLRQISGARIGRPWALDIARDGRLYVIDGGDQDPANSRSGLLVMTRQGEIIARWSRYGYEPGNLVWPHDLAVSDQRDVFVGEVFDSNRIQRFKPDCRLGIAAG